ncbi:MAG: hypothetical protein FWG88_11020 [Oscillospiraceae bacterium]|nr:hypothetical protein [Oscillospiraceae bacterium]
MLRGFIFGSAGAMLFTIIEIITVIVLYHRYKKKIETKSGGMILPVAILLCIAMVVFTWMFLLGRNSGAQRSKVDRSLISELTEETLENSLGILSKTNGISNYRELSENMNFQKGYTAFYHRIGLDGERMLGFVTVSIYRHKDTETAKSRMRLSFYKFNHYDYGDNEAYLGRAVIERGADTFMLGGTARYIRTEIRVGRYVISISESTDSYSLNDLKTNDVLKILNGIALEIDNDDT